MFVLGEGGMGFREEIVYKTLWVRWYVFFVRSYDNLYFFVAVFQILTRHLIGSIFPKC